MARGRGQRAAGSAVNLRGVKIRADVGADVGADGR